MSTDLESALRAMLQERATDVDALPADFQELASLDVIDLDSRRRFDRHHHRTVWLIAAAIAAVLAVVGTLLAVGHSGGRGTPAATHTSTAPTTSATPTVLQHSTCTAALPQSWRAAAKPTQYGGVSNMPLAISPDGSTVLMTRDFGTARDVAVVKDGGAARSIYSVPQPNENQVENASLDGKYAAVDLDRLPRNSNGVIPEARQVLLINLSTGSIKQLDSSDESVNSHGVQGRTIDGSLLWNGHVYWDVRKTYTDRVTTIRDYDIASGKTGVAGHGGGWIPRLLAAGVTFDPQGSAAIALPRALPGAVDEATVGRRNFVQTDGRAYAWTTRANQLGWWAPGQRAVTVITPPPGFESDSLEAVAGTFLFFSADVDNHSHTFVTDARTGATAMLPTEVQYFPATASGVALGYAFLGALKESPTAVIRMDTRGLPELRC